MLLEPKLYLNNVTDISIEILKLNNIQGLILDVDNTLIDFDHNVLPGAKKWIQNLRQNNIKLCILSNTNKLAKVKKISKELEIDDYIYFAKKPLKNGFNKAKKILNLQTKNIAVVGDQIFTDVLGANRSKMFAILVKPIGEKDIWITRLKRPLEQFFINKYKKKRGSNDVL